MSSRSRSAYLEELSLAGGERGEDGGEGCAKLAAVLAVDLGELGIDGHVGEVRGWAASPPFRESRSLRTMLSAVRTATTRTHPRRSPFPEKVEIFGGSSPVATKSRSRTRWHGARPRRSSGNRVRADSIDLGEVGGFERRERFGVTPRATDHERLFDVGLTHTDGGRSGGAHAPASGIALDHPRASPGDRPGRPLRVKFTPGSCEEFPDAWRRKRFVKGL